MPEPQNRQKEQKPFLVVSCIFNLCVHSTVYGVSYTMHVEDDEDT